MLMTAISPYILDPIWEQFRALLPEREVDHPLGGHRRRIPDQLLRKRLAERDLIGVISEKGKSAALQATNRWVVERTNSWQNAHKKLVWCTERMGRVIDFWVAFSNAIIIVGRLVRKAWVRYHWEGRPHRRP